MGSTRRITVALVGLVVLVLAGWFVRGALDTPETDAQSTGLRERALSDLPAEVTDTWQLIERGGPFPNDEDGAVFQNREGLLPDEDRGYYHEYTVVTPGSRDRGEQRLVTGAEDEVYYTPDHYESFVTVDVSR